MRPHASVKASVLVNGWLRGFAGDVHDAALSSAKLRHVAAYKDVSGKGTASLQN